MKSRSITCILFLFFLIVPVVLAAGGQAGQPLPRPPAFESEPWVFTGGPVGGLGYDVRMDPTNPDVMYVTDAKSGVFKSTDGGATWVPKNKGITTRMGPSGDEIPVFSLTIDPNDTSRLWAGTQYNSDAYLSENGGESWTVYDNGIAEEFLSIRGFTIEPGNSNVVYLAAEVSSREWNIDPLPGLGLDMVKGVVYKTADGGDNWNKIWEGDNLARYVWIHPQNHNLLYVSTGIFDREAANSDAVTFFPGGVGILRSKDGGQTWEELDEANGLNAEELYFGSLYMHPTKPEILLAAAGNDPYTTLLQKKLGGIYRTKDGGDTWVEVLGPHNFSAVEFCEGDPDVAYAGSLDGFFRSEDAGLTWTETGGVAWGPPGIVAGFPIDIQCDPRDADRLFVNNYGGGNYLSRDGGISWTVASKGYTGGIMRHVEVSRSNAAQVFATARSGIFTSHDGGATWEGLSNGPARWMEMVGLGVDPENSQHLLIANSDYGPVPLESTDGGQTWSLIETGLTYPPGNTLVRILFAPSNPGLIYASVGDEECLVAGKCDQTGGGVMVSRDGGASWEKTAIDSGIVLGIDVFAKDSHGAYAAVVGGGLYRTEDGGKVWHLIHANPGPPSVQREDPDEKPRILATLAIDPNNFDKLYAGFRDGSLLVSLDGGATWDGPMEGIPPEADVVALVVDQHDPDVVYAGTLDSGVYVSLDGGFSWQGLSEGLINRAVFDLSLSADGTVLYMAADGGGVSRLGTPARLNFLPIVTGQ
jgi:photosystem II stability/assembly factor-like uncharacterized protein